MSDFQMRNTEMCISFMENVREALYIKPHNILSTKTKYYLISLTQGTTNCLQMKNYGNLVYIGWSEFYPAIVSSYFVVYF